MSGSQSEFESQMTTLRGEEYTAGVRARHRRVGGVRRLLFFGLASCWGFIVGVAGVLAAIGASGQPVPTGVGVAARLIPALVLASAGGLVVAAAYKESKSRAR